MTSESNTGIVDQDDLRLRATIDRSVRHPVMFFFASGAAWLAFAIVLGFIASYKVHDSDFLAGIKFLNYGRVYPAHINVLFYGWGCQAAFGLVIWLLARLSRSVCRSTGIVLTAGHLWNFGVMAGTLGVLGGFVVLRVYHGLVFHPGPLQLRRQNLRRTVVSPCGSFLVSLGLSHRASVCFRLQRAPGYGCRDQCLV